MQRPVLIGYDIHQDRQDQHHRHHQHRIWILNFEVWRSVVMFMMLQFALQPEVNLLYIFPMSVSCPQKPAASFNLSESCRVRVEAFTPNNSQCSTGGAEWFRNWSTYSWNWSRCFFESSPRNALLIVILFFYWYLPVPTILPIIPVNRKSSSVSLLYTI